MNPGGFVVCWAEEVIIQKLCLIAGVKMAPIVEMASAFIKAVCRGIGLSIRAFHTFVL